MYGFCKDSSSVMFTSCYKLNSGASTSTVVTVSGTYTVASSNSDYTFSADSNCNLDEANGLLDINKSFLNISSILGAIHPTTGEYSYFMTTGYPWTPIKFAGDQVIVNYKSCYSNIPCFRARLTTVVLTKFPRIYHLNLNFKYGGGSF